MPSGAHVPAFFLLQGSPRRAGACLGLGVGADCPPEVAEADAGR